MGTQGVNLAAFIVRQRIWIAVVWLGVAAALIPLSGNVETELRVAAHIDGTESAAVTEALRHRFESAFADPAILVITGVPAPGEPTGRRVLGRIVAAVEAVEGVSGTVSYLNAADPFFLGDEGVGTFVVAGLDSGGGAVDALIPSLRGAAARLAERLRPTYPGIALRWTGEAALNADLRRASSEEAQNAELRVLPVTLALLLAVFGTVTAALLPVLVGLMTISLVLGFTVVLAQWGSLSILLINVVTMIGLGLGIDYALLTVSRFREALRNGCDARTAAEEAARHAGGTIALSGTTVAIGFSALLLVPLNELQSIAVGGVLVVAFSVLVAATLLPGLLAWIGPRINGGRIRARVVRRLPAFPWHRWGAWVVAHPIRVLILAGVPLLLLASQAARLNIDLPRGDWLPRGTESVRAVHDLEAMGRRGVVDTVRVIVELPAGATVGEETGWAAIRHLGEALGDDPRIDRVRAVTSLAGAAAIGPQLIELLPTSVRQAFVSRDGRATLVEVIPRGTVEASELTRFVRELRALEPAELTGLPGTRLRIGGLPAFNAEYEDAIEGWLPSVIGLVVLATFVALAAGFRCLLIPLKAVVLNLVSVAAAFGAVVLVFQDGHGAAILGLHGATGGVFPIVPVLVFCTVFGLSMDYEVFLVARVAEARRNGLDDSAALVEGLARTGGVITSAAAIMIAVFAAFVLGDFLLIKMLGFALAVTVFIDATLVRLAIGPALIRLAGRWNWWPGETARIGEPDRLDQPLTARKD